MIISHSSFTYFWINLWTNHPTNIPVSILDSASKLRGPLFHTLNSKVVPWPTGSMIHKDGKKSSDTLELSTLLSSAAMKSFHVWWDGLLSALPDFSSPWDQCFSVSPWYKRCTDRLVLPPDSSSGGPSLLHPTQPAYLTNTKLHLQKLDSRSGFWPDDGNKTQFLPTQLFIRGL